jgi:hypothetical protein
MPSRTSRIDERGQLALPGLAVILLCVFLFLAFAVWAKRSLWQMRINLAADASALSAARSEAEILNYIASSNSGISLFIQKANIPLVHDAVGVMQEDRIPDYLAWHALLIKETWGFKTVPAAIGEVVSRLNGGIGKAPYFPVPMDPYLTTQGIHVGIILDHFPFLAYRHFTDAYFARAWSPSKAKAQPPHKTTWLVSRNGVQAMASARLWLDVSPGALFNNGGFPRDHEMWLRGLFIQSFYAQFNARLLPRPAISLGNFLTELKRHRGTI